MEKPPSLGAAGGLSGEAGSTRRVPGGFRVVEAFSPLYSGAPHRPLEVTLHSSECNQRFGEASPGQGQARGPWTNSSPRTSFPETSVSGPGMPGVSSSGCTSQSGSTCLQPHKPSAIRGILKNSSNPKAKSPTKERKKHHQHWDEMNILATYHPADKNYGYMKVDEPKTPFHRLQDSSEELSPESSSPLAPEMLRKRLATMDTFYPKVHQYHDNRRQASPDNFSKTHSSDFEKHRKAHYDEGKFFKAQKNLPLDRESSESNASADSSNQSVMLNTETRSMERDWTGGLSREVKDGEKLAPGNHILQNRDSSTFRNQSLALATGFSQKDFEVKRKEYYSKGRYLRCCAYPELEEDTDHEQDCETLQLSKN